MITRENYDKDHILLLQEKGHDFRDYICPDTFENGSDHFRIGDRFGRVLFLVLDGTLITEHTTAYQ